jgi:DNA segregation ATPase FtsK/SpoIIIE-like protein
LRYSSSQHRWSEATAMSLRLVSKTRKGIQLDDGTILLQMMGAEGEGDPTEDDTEENEEDTDDGDEDGDKPESKPGSDADELEKLRKRMKAADRRAAAAEQKLRDIDLEGKSELEQTKVKLEQAEAANEELNTKLAQLQRERAFLGSNTVTWHDPEIALSKLRWDDLVDEDGEVDTAALDRAIKDLAKAKPFLVKSDKVADDEENKPPASGQPSGGKVGSGKKQSKQELDREALLRKYPALRA